MFKINNDDTKTTSIDLSPNYVIKNPVLPESRFMEQDSLYQLETNVYFI